MWWLKRLACCPYKNLFFMHPHSALFFLLFFLLSDIFNHFTHLNHLVLKLYQGFIVKNNRRTLIEKKGHIFRVTKKPSLWPASYCIRWFFQSASTFHIKKIGYVIHLLFEICQATVYEIYNLWPLQFFPFLHDFPSRFGSVHKKQKKCPCATIQWLGRLEHTCLANHSPSS